MSDQAEQIFGYTAPTPKGMVGFIQLFKDGLSYRMVVRQHDQDPGLANVLAASCPITTQGLREFIGVASRAVAADAPSAAESIHPAPVIFTDAELEFTPILQFFHYQHLPIHLQERSEPFARMARQIIDTTKPSAERTAGLRKLLEAKDCVVRAALAK